MWIMHNFDEKYVFGTYKAYIIKSLPLKKTMFVIIFLSSISGIKGAVSVILIRLPVWFANDNYKILFWSVLEVEKCLIIIVPKLSNNI